MSTHNLPDRLNLDHLKQQAKSLLKAAKAGDQTARDRIEAYGSRSLSELKLASAQHAIAKEYGFESWPKLKFHVEFANRDLAEKISLFLDVAWHWGDRSRAQALVAEEPSITKSSILAAAAYGDVETVEQHLKLDPNCAIKTGGSKDWSPLLYATWSCFWPTRGADLLQVIRLLLDHGADPNSSWLNSTYNQSESALYGTVEANSVAGARLLLQAGADPNDNESLYHACEKWNLDLLMALGEYGLRAQDISYCVKHALDMRWPEAVYWFLETRG